MICTVRDILRILSSAYMHELVSLSRGRGFFLFCSIIIITLAKCSPPFVCMMEGEAWIPSLSGQALCLVTVLPLSGQEGSVDAIFYLISSID